MRVKHPYALDDDAPSPDATVHYGARREWAAVDEDGTFEIPEDKAGWLDGWAASYGYDASDLLVTDGAGGDAGDTAQDPEDGTCAGTTAAGDPCSNPAGDDGYCRYHGPEDG